jgi:hypothetical protein
VCDFTANDIDSRQREKAERACRRIGPSNVGFGACGSCP